MTNRTNRDEQILKRFGERLRYLRKLRALTQDDLAAQAGFSRSYYTELETGKRNTSLLNLHKLAECLQVSLSDLLDIGKTDGTQT